MTNDNYSDGHLNQPDGLAVLGFFVDVGLRSLKVHPVLISLFRTVARKTWASNNCSRKLDSHLIMMHEQL